MTRVGPQRHKKKCIFARTVTDREKPKSALRKTCQRATWIGPGSNPGFCGKNLMTNGLRYKTAARDLRRLFDGYLVQSVF